LLAGIHCLWNVQALTLFTDRVIKDVGLKKAIGLNATTERTPINTQLLHHASSGEVSIGIDTDSRKLD
jgi:hypothetical protein